MSSPPFITYDLAPAKQLYSDWESYKDANVTL